MELVSVIILSYNNLNLLSQAIDSVIIQDYPKIQLIISDDASQDFNMGYIEEYINENNSGNIIESLVLGNPQNQGTVRNLNKALKMATGEVIIPLAADDVLYDKTVLKNFVQCFNQTDVVRDVITSQVKRYDFNLNVFKGNVLTEENIALLQSDDFSKLYGLLALKCFIPSGGTAYRKSIILEYGLFDEKYRLVEDWPSFLKLTRNKVKINYGGFISVKHRDEGVSSNAASESKKLYQTDLIHIMENEILQNINFAPLNMQKEILEQCHDKRIIYDLRFEFRYYNNWKKVLYLFRKNTITAISRRIKRRIIRDEQ